MESMTRDYGSRAVPTQLWPELKDSSVKEARDCIVPMGVISENIAERYSISRADQDVFGAGSHIKASKAQNSGLFDKNSSWSRSLNPPTEGGEGEGSPTPHSGETVTVSTDDGIRHDASLESMAKLKSVFKKTRTTTASNSSQISDGAATALMCDHSTAKSLGLSSSIIGKYAGSSTVGVPPDEMGIGSAYAIPPLLASAGLTLEDMDVWEINEAFASQALYCVRKLGLERAMEHGRNNPRGGALAVGTSARGDGITLLSEMEGGRYGEVGDVSMCVGTGMGMAGLILGG